MVELHVERCTSTKIPARHVDKQLKGRGGGGHSETYILYKIFISDQRLDFRGIVVLFPAEGTRQAMDFYRNIEKRFCKHCCSGKTISTTYSECAVVALGIQRAMRMRHIFICGLPGSKIFFHIISYNDNFFREKKKRYRKQNVCFEFLYKFYLTHFSF